MVSPKRRDVAAWHSRPSREREKKEHTNWIKAVAWNMLAEIAGVYLNKGNLWWRPSALCAKALTRITTAVIEA